MRIISGLRTKLETNIQQSVSEKSPHLGTRVGSHLQPIRQPIGRYSTNQQIAAHPVDPPGGAQNIHGGNTEAIDQVQNLDSGHPDSGSNELRYGAIENDHGKLQCRRKIGSVDFSSVYEVPSR